MERRRASSYLKGYTGVSMAEIIVILGLIGLLATLATTRILTTKQASELEAARKNILTDTYSIQHLAETTLGSLPMNYGLAQVFRRFSRMEPETLPNGTTTVGACTSDNQATFRLPNGVMLTSVGEQWGSSSDKPNMRNTLTGQPIPSGRPGDWVCMALKGTQSNNLNQNAVWVFMEKNGPPTLAQLPPRTYTEVGLYSSMDTTGTSINSEVITYDNGSDGTNWHFGYLSNQIMALRRFLGESEANLALAQDRINYILQNYSVDIGGDKAKDSNFWNAKWYMDRTVAQGGVKSSVMGMTNSMGTSATQIRFITSTGSGMTQIKATDFGKNLEIQGKSWTDIKKEIIDSRGGQSWYDSTVSWWTSALASGGQFSAWYWQAPVAEHIEWQLLSGYINGLYSSTGSDLDKIKSLEIVYKDTAQDKYYRVNGSFFSPLKVSLVGINAQLDTVNGFLLDVDGFVSQKTEPILTTGGLAQSEAWLATDRAQDGFVTAEGILDGVDVFGDHQGQFKNGYEDLAHLYAAYLKTDANGLRYLDLTPLTPSQKQALLAQRQSGALTGFVPSLDLKLVLANGSVQDAAQVFERIYVDSQSVGEHGVRNKITDRASVVYRNGRVATSADQWFQTEALARDVLNTRLAKR